MQFLSVWGLQDWLFGGDSKADGFVFYHLGNKVVIERRLFFGFWLFAIFIGVYQSVFGIVECGADDLSPQLQSWIELYGSGWRGNDDALRAFFEAADLHEREWKQSPFLRAIYGSACVARARLVSDFQKPRWLRLGAAYLNAAVAEAPDEVEPRFLRAISFSVLPRRAGVVEMVRADFEVLVKAAEENNLRESCRQKIFYHAGSFALRERDPRALALLQRAAHLDPKEGLDRERLIRLLQAAEHLVEE